MQVLAIDLGTDLLPSLALGAEPPSTETMGLPPEPPRRPLLTRPLGIKTFLFFGLIESALGLLGFFAYYWAGGWRPFYTLHGYSSAFEHRATTLTFLGIVSGQLGCLFASRDGSLWQRLSLRTNRWIAGGLAVELVLALALVYVPHLNGVFSMAGVPPAWLAVLPCGAAMFLVLDEARRALAGRITK
jgi:magnesium-transporting ATPase (P-type)